MLREIDRDELAEWMAFSRLEPIESPTTLTAQLCSFLAAIGGQKTTVNTFLGIPEQSEAEPDVEQLASEDMVNQSLFESISEAWFIGQDREDEFREWQANRDGDHSRRT